MYLHIFFAVMLSLIITTAVYVPSPLTLGLAIYFSYAVLLLFIDHFQKKE